MIDHNRENKRRDRVYGPVERGTNPLHASPEQLKKWGYENMSHDEIVALGSRHNGYRFML